MVVAFPKVMEGLEMLEGWEKSSDSKDRVLVWLAHSLAIAEVQITNKNAHMLPARIPISSGNLSHTSFQLCIQ